MRHDVFNLPQLMRALVFRDHAVTWVAAAVSALATAAAADPAWRALPNAPVAGRFDDVCFLDERLGWTGFRNKVYRTVDGGASWRMLEAPMGHIRCIAFTTPANGWIGSIVDSTVMFATTDSGLTWRPVEFPEPRPRGICALSVVNASVVYGSGSIVGNPTVVKTVDGGVSWTSIDLSAVATGLVDCNFFTPDSGFVVGRVGTGTRSTHRPIVLFTADGGTSWEPRYTSSDSGAWCWKISFPNRRIGFASVESYDRGGPPIHCLKTEDGGQTWRKVLLSSQSSLTMQGIGFATEMRGWAGGAGDQVQQTTDGGLTWSPAGWGDRVNRIRFLTPTLGFAAGATIYKYSDPTAIVPQSFTDIKRRWR